MADWETKIFAADAEHLLEIAANDPDVRRQLRRIAVDILARTREEPGNEPLAEEEIPLSTPDALVSPPAPQTHPPRASNPPNPSPAGSEPLRPLTLGQGRPAPPLGTRPSDTPSEVAPVELLARSRRRAATARQALEHIRAEVAKGAGALPLPDDVETRAWLDAYYFSSGASAGDDRPLARVVDALEATAEALAHAGVSPAARGGGRHHLSRALPLLAQAQSALRQALFALGISNDADQIEIFQWLSATAARHRVFISRHMRVDDPADPATCAELMEQIAHASGRSGPLAATNASLGKVRRGIAELPRERDSPSAWAPLVEAIVSAVRNGVPASHVVLRDLLLPLVDEFPEDVDMPEECERVLREIDRYLASRPVAVPARESEPSPEVREMNRRLEGRSLVLIGGSRRPDTQEALRSAFGLRELVWIETREHQSISGFEPVVARDDIAAVLLAIRWSSHSFGDVKRFCDAHGKPLVRLPGGYNPNQVAAQLLAQASGQLPAEGA